MKGILFASILSTLLLMIAAAPATAQQPGKIPRIALLIGSSLAANAVRIEAFRHSLRDLGYIEGKNIAIKLRSAEGKFDRLPELAAEIVRLNVDVIVTRAR